MDSRIKLSKLSAYWNNIPQNIRGVLWILASSFFLSLMMVALKYASNVMNFWELLFIRSLYAIVFILPIVFRQGITSIYTQRPAFHLLRGALGGCSFISFFLAIIHLDLTLATTLGFSRSLFVIIFAIVFLGEIVGWRRSLATIVGFAGVVVCLNPGTDSFNPWMFSALLFAFFAALAMITVKSLTRTENPLAIVLYTYISVGLLTAGPALYYWQTPTFYELFLVAIIAIFSTLGQACLVQGLKAGETTVVAPFEYSRILYASLFGYYLFNEIPTISTALGATLIVASSLYIAVRESRR
ncbi:MAG: drug/metabolite transporter (DMT)-like permease [Parasphingorhabdus sp.]